MRKTFLAILFASGIFASVDLLGWGRPHLLITQAAVNRLPQWQKNILAAENKNLVRLYCILPDLVRTSKRRNQILKKIKAGEKVAPGPRIAAVVMVPALKLGADCHRLWPEGTKLYKKNIIEQTFTAYLTIIVEHLKKNDIKQAMRYFGVLAHLMEDISCPAHAGAALRFPPWSKSYFSYVKSVKPSFKYDEPYQQYNAHKTIDNCPFSIKQLEQALGDYKPQLLGKTVKEVARKAETRLAEIDKVSSADLVVMLECVVNKDTKSDKYINAGVTSAKGSAELVADVLYSTMCISFGHHAN